MTPSTGGRTVDPVRTPYRGPSVIPGRDVAGRDVAGRDVAGRPVIAGRSARAFALDVGPAAALALVGFVVASLATGGARAPLSWGMYSLIAFSCGALVARRRRPDVVVAVTGACAIAYPHLGYEPRGMLAAPFMLALFVAAARGRRVTAIGAAAGFLALFLALGVVAGMAPRGVLPWLSGWLVAVLVAGEVARARRDYLAAVEQRAAEAERTREEEALHRATQERLRIARDVHDVLSHSISVINVQAGVAVHLLDSRPDQARTALVAIKQASKDALRDLRTTLGVLRDDPGDRSPAPGLAGLDALVSTVEASGVAVDVVVEGDRRPLGASVDSAAFRIVQEALSNVVRHARRPVGATVTLTFDHAGVRVRVDDDGAGTAAAPPGSGVRGMRERATAHGGSLDAGPRPGGGWHVDAVLPDGGQP